MHIPDGFLDTKTAIATSVFSFTAISVALRRLKNNLEPSQIPLLGLSASFIFVAQMLNFPVIGGTSGHLIGAVLAAVLLGPDAAIICMTAVLLIQTFIFADGGVTALGANILNMGVIAVLGGYSVYSIIFKFIRSPRGTIIASIFAGWFSIVIASIFCAGELVWSGTSDWSVIFPSMTNIHILIGIGEGIITGLVISAIYKTKPVVLETSLLKNYSGSKKSIITYGLIFGISLLLLVTPFVSEWPDGLESVASALGFDVQAKQGDINIKLLSDYSVPGLNNAVVATIIAGLLGAFFVFLLALVVGKILIQKTKNQPSSLKT